MMDALALPPDPGEMLAWGDGPWNSEPDFEQFEHQDYACFVRRTPSGTLAGYIAVPSTHPWYRLMPRVNVHGGITFGSKMGPYWCLGFDCGHAGDLNPEIRQLLSQICPPKLLASVAGGEYRTFEYVRQQVMLLADYASEAA